MMIVMISHRIVMPGYEILTEEVLSDEQTDMMLGDDPGHPRAEVTKMVHGSRFDHGKTVV